MKCQTQWVYVGMGAACIGLNYQGVDVVLKHNTVQNADQIFADIQIMEFAALKVMSDG